MASLLTYYLEMHSEPSYADSVVPPTYLLMECEAAQPQFSRFLYRLVGEAWDWTDRLAWPESAWADLVESPNMRTWVAYQQGVIAGYFELRKEGDEVEILYFGLSPQFIGKGIGGALLRDAIQQAWAWSNPNRVWVHTCNLDHPAALDNYKRRGFKLYKTEEEVLPE